MAQLITHPADARSQTRNMPRRQFTGGDSLASVLNGRRGMLYSGIVRNRKSTRLNSSHANISYAVFCLKKKNKIINTIYATKPTDPSCLQTTQLALLDVHCAVTSSLMRRVSAYCTDCPLSSPRLLLPSV